VGDRVNPVLGFNENYKLKSDEIFLKSALKIIPQLMYSAYSYILSEFGRCSSL
jgi:hypothetical protein